MRLMAAWGAIALGLAACGAYVAAIYRGQSGGGPAVVGAIGLAVAIAGGVGARDEAKRRRARKEFKGELKRRRARRVRALALVLLAVFAGAAGFLLYRSLG